MPPTGYVEASELETGAEGEFELVLSCEPRRGTGCP